MYRGDDIEERIDIDKLHRETSAETIKKWLDDCISALNITQTQGGPGYDRDEKKFIESVDEYFKRFNRLSPKQLIKVKSLYDRI